MPHVCVSIKSKCLFIIERKIACHSIIYNNFSKKSHNYYLTTDISIKLHININKCEENQKTIQKPVKPLLKCIFAQSFQRIQIVGIHLCINTCKLK